jgi:hypothetical protein
MILDFEFKTGLVFGIEADELFIMDENDKMSEEANQVIYLHIGFITIAFILGQ